MPAIQTHIGKHSRRDIRPGRRASGLRSRPVTEPCTAPVSPKSLSPETLEIQPCPSKYGRSDIRPGYRARRLRSRPAPEPYTISRDSNSCHAKRTGAYYGAGGLHSQEARGIPATRGNTPRRSGEQLHWWQLRAPSYAGTRAQLSMPYVVPLQVQPTTERDRRAIQLAGTRAHTTLMHQDPRNLSDIRVGCSCIPTARWARSHVSLLPL